jgi:hypothetical protein
MLDTPKSMKPAKSGDEKADFELPLFRRSVIDPGASA